MTTDIVERLRSVDEGSSACLEAADEIERLRAWNYRLLQRADAAQTEVERLRALLRDRPRDDGVVTDNLLRMDSVTQITAIRDAIGAGVMSPNEGRGKLDLKPVTGGESPYLQQQNAVGGEPGASAGKSE